MAREDQLRLEVRGPLLAVDQGVGPREREQHSRSAVRPHGRRLGSLRRDPRRAQGAGKRGRGRRDRARVRDHQGRARPAQPSWDQLPPVVPGPRHPRLGRPHDLERPVVEVSQRPPSLQLHRGVDARRNPVGRLRAERPGALGSGCGARSPRSCSASMARRCALRGHPGGGVLRQVRRGDQPARLRRRRPAHLRDRDRAGEAGRVRRLPYRPVLGRRGSSVSE